jgi:hypothetical protein
MTLLRVNYSKYDRSFSNSRDMIEHGWLDRRWRIVITPVLRSEAKAIRERLLPALPKLFLGLWPRLVCRRAFGAGIGGWSEGLRPTHRDAMDGAPGRVGELGEGGRASLDTPRSTPPAKLAGTPACGRASRMGHPGVVAFFGWGYLRNLKGGVLRWA